MFFMIVIEIGGTSDKLHTIKEPHYQEVVLLIFFSFFLLIFEEKS